MQVIRTVFKVKTIDGVDVPIVFATESEVRAYMAKMKENHPYFHSIISPYKSTLYEEIIELEKQQ